MYTCFGSRRPPITTASEVLTSTKRETGTSNLSFVEAKPVVETFNFDILKVTSEILGFPAQAAHPFGIIRNCKRSDNLVLAFKAL